MIHKNFPQTPPPNKKSPAHPAHNPVTVLIQAQLKRIVHPYSSDAGEGTRVLLLRWWVQRPDGYGCGVTMILLDTGLASIDKKDTSKNKQNFSHAHRHCFSTLKVF